MNKDKDMAQAIEGYAEAALNSDNPKYWEAALQDILQVVRQVIFQPKTEGK